VRVLLAKLPKPTCPAFLIEEMRFHIVVAVSLQGIFFADGRRTRTGGVLQLFLLFSPLWHRCRSRCTADSQMNDSTPEALFESHLELAAKIGSHFQMANGSIEESVQEARIALWSAAQSFDPAKGEFAPFASTVIRNHLRNAYNKAKRRSVEITTLDISVSDDDDSQAKTLKEIIPSHDASPLLEAERVDVRANIRDGLNALTTSQREVMESFAEGKTYADIAREKGVSKAAVRQMAERAADQMRPELQARGTIQFMPARPAEQDLEQQERYTPPENKPPSGASILLIFVLAFVALVLLVAIFGRA